MSELKAFTFSLGRYTEDGYPCVVAVDDENNPRLAYDKKFYLKSEADKVIAELKDKCQMHDFFWEGCGFKKLGFKNSIDVRDYCDELKRQNEDLLPKCRKANRELKEVMNVMQVSGERIPSGYYKKPEVDAVIAEKDAEIAELKDIDSKNRSAYYKDLSMMAKDVEHQKYKRCLAMAYVEWLKQVIIGLHPESILYRKAFKRERKWKELAEKFKERSYPDGLHI